ncbi:hypothetical protein [Kribbella sindirgiensis]|uniref:Alkaline shock response membrane anchor protein AmaP n=1 Tax=Kribbella sindirgiensis TaxID=1124744 RepID=A0A4R0ILI0_9ACTN|nr:hypothetical protein [Kribbella sindirgiensis]TCC32156.1 hypothetical protein E0H50_18180 [Kribbella sindirgiensis]
MRRGVIAVDRTVGVVVALVLIAAGALAVSWWYDVLPGAPDRISLSGPADHTRTGWWPWATGTGGVLLALLGLWWLLRHLPRRISGRFTLTDTDPNGRLVADAHAAVAAAARDLTSHPEIRDSSGRVVADRGELVAELQCTIEPSADLDAVHPLVTQSASDLAAVLGLPQLRHRIVLHVARTDKTATQQRVL